MTAVYLIKVDRDCGDSPLSNFLRQKLMSQKRDTIAPLKKTALNRRPMRFFKVTELIP